MRIRTILPALAVLAASQLAAVETRPNIILIYTDDQGYADVGAYGHEADVRTPNLDRLAAEGVLFTRGYVTAPQCIPSRAGIVTGRHQNAFGVDDNSGGPLPHDEYTVAQRLRDAGYVTGMIGKWHLEIGFDRNRQPYFSRENLPDRHGFEEMFAGSMQQYHANFDLEGHCLPDDFQMIVDPHYRIDIQTRAALTFLERRRADDRPFFLYLCWFAPHSPIEGPPQYTERLPHVEERTRREALASILAMDDGLGMIRDKLEDMELTENTLIFFISDNGAPLAEGAYVGSLNTPLIGEKGMLTDAGQRVPFIAAWPGKIPGGQVFDEMVWSLDAAATAVALADASLDDRIEGKNLIPWLSGERAGSVHEALYWRWRTQAAILTDDWKFVRLGGDRRYLFATGELGKERAEHNRIDEFPEVARSLEEQLLRKADTWATSGLPEGAIIHDRRFFDMHVDDTTPGPPLEGGRTGARLPWDDARPQTRPDAPVAEWRAASLSSRQIVAPTGVPHADAERMQGWFVRQGEVESHAESIRVLSNRPEAPTFFGRAFPEGLIAPVTVEIEARAPRPTTLRMTWLPESGRGALDFVGHPRAELTIRDGRDWTNTRATVESPERVKILRVLLEGTGEIPVEVRTIRLREGSGALREFHFGLASASP